MIAHARSRPIALLLPTLVSLVLLAPTAAAEITGQVVDAETGNPISSAIVRVQATSVQTFSDSQGRFTLDAEAGAHIVAGAKGYFYSGAPAPAISSMLLELTPVPSAPNSDVTFVDGSTCVGCHFDIVASFDNARMGHAGRNTWVADIYAGNGTPNGSEGFVYTRDSVHATLNPNSECAACHQPERFVNEPFSALLPPDDNDDAVRRGVSCLTCHQMSDVDESRPNFPGMHPQTTTFARGSIVRYGTLGDVDYHAEGRMRAAYQPQLPSAMCATCHQDSTDPQADGTFEGVISESTYLEWLNSPYGDPEDPLYQSCMSCHSSAMNLPNAAPNAVSYIRPDGEVRSHTFEGTTPEYLEKALELDMQTSFDDGELTVDVALTNSGTGHDVPSGVTERNVILLVEATDDDGTPLPYTGTQVVDTTGGVGEPTEGYYANLPGKLYGRVVEDAQGNGPVPFTEAVRLRMDTGIDALATDTTRYTFSLEDARRVNVRARVIYRRAFRETIDAKGWTKDGQGRPLADLKAPHFGHLMASDETILTVRKSGGCTATEINQHNTTPGMVFLAFVFALCLALRPRAAARD